ncbi:uncharacterized protein LOC115633777 isoform X1 [Scaptodrosophila lebanonensis]|uniref:Uncharacterized protein LOC115633777 isoform X1 n=1 Tax=Drosophila lebanonensis TaxID=7225 RepID=A0A6J2UIS4_DROLE|nr:uncharacterized protein LOC115633777 isoform X1 [Scaptodrosophila lebanonensis]
MQTSISVLRNCKNIRPSKLYLLPIFRCYGDKIRDKGLAEENVHFLKMQQRDQLKQLRRKILKQRENLGKQMKKLEQKIEKIELEKREEDKQVKNQTKKNSKQLD